MTTQARRDATFAILAFTAGFSFGLTWTSLIVCALLCGTYLLWTR